MLRRLKLSTAEKEADLEYLIVTTGLGPLPNQKAVIQRFKTYQLPGLIHDGWRCSAWVIVPGCMIVRCQIIQNSIGQESTCTPMFSFYLKVKESVTFLGKSDQKWIDDIRRHAVIEVTYLTDQETAAPVVVESKGQGGGTKSSWVLLISHSSTINNVTCVGAWTDFNISERSFSIYYRSAPYAFHDHDHLHVLTNAITNKASPLCLEVNEYHQDRECHNIHDEGVPLQANGETKASTPIPALTSQRWRPCWHRSWTPFLRCRSIRRSAKMLMRAKRWGWRGARTARWITWVWQWTISYGRNPSLNRGARMGFSTNGPTRSPGGQRVRAWTAWGSGTWARNETPARWWAEWEERRWRSPAIDGEHEGQHICLGGDGGGMWQPGLRLCLEPPLPVCLQYSLHIHMITLNEVKTENIYIMSMAKPQKAFATRRPGEAVPWEPGECWRSRRIKKFEFLSFCNKVKSY